MDAAKLCGKYRAMLRLRELHASDDEPNPRAAMAALAREFPGSLRELDELPMDVLRARIDELAAAADDASRVTEWMRAQMAFHARLRGALAVKRWLAGRKQVDDETRRAFASEAHTLDWPDDARDWTLDLASVADPPRGRILGVVYDRVARDLAIAPERVRRLVFGERKPAR